MAEIVINTSGHNAGVIASILEATMSEDKPYQPPTREGVRDVARSIREQLDAREREARELADYWLEMDGLRLRVKRAIGQRAGKYGDNLDEQGKELEAYFNDFLATIEYVQGELDD